MKYMLILWLFAIAPKPGGASHDLFQFVISPQLSAEQMAGARTTISETLLREAKGADILTIVNATNLQQVFYLKLSDKIDSVPIALRPKYLPKAHPEISTLKSILENLQKTQLGNQGNILRYLKNYRVEQHNGYNQHIFWIGSPIPGARESTDKLNSFKDAHPNDASFNSTISVWSTLHMANRLKGVKVHIVHSADLSEFTDIEGYRDYHQKKIQRAFAIFIADLGGALKSFGGSVDILKNLKTSQFQTITFEKDPTQAEPSTIEFQPNTTTNGAIIGGPKIWSPPIAPPTPLDIDNPEVDTTGPIAIGLRFHSPDNPRIDLDLITKLRGDDREVSFRSEGISKFGGQLVKDYSDPGVAINSHGHEVIIYSSEDADIRRLLPIAVRHWGGTTEKPITGEVRVVFQGTVYRKEFEMNSKRGDEGQSPRTSPNWMFFDIRSILGTPSQIERLPQENAQTLTHRNKTSETQKKSKKEFSESNTSPPFSGSEDLFRDLSKEDLAKPIDLENPDSRTLSSPLVFAIRWDIPSDIDLYVQVEGDKELFYGSTQSEMFDGVFPHDYTSNPGNATYETIEYRKPVKLHQIDSLWLNHYSGEATQPFHVEIRLQFQGKIFRHEVTMPASRGNRGKGNRHNSPQWKKVLIADIVSSPQSHL